MLGDLLGCPLQAKSGHTERGEIARPDHQRDPGGDERGDHRPATGATCEEAPALEQAKERVPPSVSTQNRPLMDS